MKNFTSFTPASLYIRQAETPDGGGDSRTVEGYALKWGVKSVIMWPWPVREILEKGCISEEMLREQTVLFTMYHDNAIILGRYTRGEGTLHLELDDTGLLVRCELPNTPDGDTALELIRRGDLSGMSFAYTTDDDSEAHVTYQRTDEKAAPAYDPSNPRPIVLRTVHTITGLYDVTITATPAYSQTEIAARDQAAATHCKPPILPDPAARSQQPDPASAAPDPAALSSVAAACQAAPAAPRRSAAGTAAALRARAASLLPLSLFLIAAVFL